MLHLLQLRNKVLFAFSVWIVARFLATVGLEGLVFDEICQVILYHVSSFTEDK